jgi:hypothetical protein
MQIRDRIVELRRLPARDLIPNPRNWRRHPKAQAAALRGLLEEVGYADALLGRELPDGRVMLIDGATRTATEYDRELPPIPLCPQKCRATTRNRSIYPVSDLPKSERPNLSIRPSH